MRRLWALLAVIGTLLPATGIGPGSRSSSSRARSRRICPRSRVGRRDPGTGEWGWTCRALPGADGKSLLPVAGQSLVLNLFDDVSFVARLVRAERIDKGMSWVGRLEGQPLSNVVLVAYDGVLTGSAVWPRAPTGSSSTARRASSSSSTTTSSPRGTACARPPDGTGPTPSVRRGADDGSLVDVLVVYTPAARAAAGGTSGMTSLVNTAVTETNTGYANSGVVQRLGWPARPS